MSPSTTGRCSRHAAAVLSNKGVGTADQWERGTATWQPITRTYYICCPGVVGRSVFAVQAWSNLWDLIWEPPSHYSMISPQFTPENKSQINQSLAMVILFVSSPGFTYSKWCRDGFGLGLGKNLHGFPRYNIEGSTEEGEVYNIYIHICHHWQSISIYLMLVLAHKCLPLNICNILPLFRCKLDASEIHFLSNEIFQ